MSLAYFSRDASEDDLRLWLPQPEKSVQELDVDMSLFLLTHVGDQFCWMVQTEKEAKAEALAAEAEDGDTVQQQIAWKRVVQGVREMCDVCETTLFNFHWACGKCGYVVCIDCYKTRKAAKSPSNGSGSGNKDDEKEVGDIFTFFFLSLSLLVFLYINEDAKIPNNLSSFPQEKDKERDLHGWLFCTSRSGHDPDKLMPTQIIAGKALECMERLVHSYRKQWNIAEFCDCPEGKKSVETTESNGSVNNGSNGICKVCPSLSFMVRFFHTNFSLISLQSLNAGSSKSDGMSNGDADGKGGVDSESVKPVNGNPAQSDSKNGGNQTGSSLLNVLADVALTKEKKPGKSKNGYGGAAVKGEAVDGAATAIGSDGESDLPSDEEEGGEHFSTLRELLIRPAPKTSSGKNSEQNTGPVAKRQRMETLEDVISCVIERGVDREPSPEASASVNAAAGSSPNASTAAVAAAPGKDSNGEPEEVAVDVELVHFKRRGDAFKTVLSRGMLPPRIMVLSESLKAYPDIPHSWLCTGKLLRLHDPGNPNNYKLFQVGLMVSVFLFVSKC
jgi:lysine-specific demethylase 3